MNQIYNNILVLVVEAAGKLKSGTGPLGTTEKMSTGFQPEKGKSLKTFFGVIVLEERRLEVVKRLKNGADFERFTVGIFEK